jgi:hypothetical protein
LRIIKRLIREDIVTNKTPTAAAGTKTSVLKLAAAAAERASAPGGMTSQPAASFHSCNDSVPQTLIRLTGTYSPVATPESWRRIRRTA